MGVFSDQLTVKAGEVVALLGLDVLNVRLIDCSPEDRRQVIRWINKEPYLMRSADAQRSSRFMYSKDAVCRVPGCTNKPSVSWLCQKHRARFRRHGERGLDDRRAKGRKVAHPLHKTWNRINRISRELGAWSDFWSFVDSVGDRPTHQHQLMARDLNLEIGPANFEWRVPVRVAFDWKNPDARRAYLKELQEKQPGWLLKQQLRRYGLTLDQFESLLASQAGVCAICQNPETLIRNGKIQRLSVDHDHENHRVRGLLCVNCNKILGHAHDSIAKLEAAIRYLAAASAKQGEVV